ncbi:methyltransferase [Streptomyces sp. NPDC090445]|uniref:methyltransferase n=1 Tax=Streptomyces sp. NPDC090445 TaxID=3365963 RepID=UPI00382D5C0E
MGLTTLADLATPMAVRVAATLRVADHLVAGRRTSAELAAAVQAHPDALDRLLRHLVSVGLFTRDTGSGSGSGRYGLTELGQQLRDDHPSGKRRWLDLNGAIGRGDLSFVELLHSVRTGEPAYPVRYGAALWEDLAADPERSASFDFLMSHHITLEHARLPQAYGWAALGHVVDVGGGSGGLLATLLAAHPELRGTVVDLPGPAAAARRLFADRGLSGRADVAPGSFFEPLPAGAGGYVLSAILHDWSDDPATALLRRCAEAAGDKGAVLVIEAIGRDGESPNTAMDLRMLAYNSGKERGLAEIRVLGERAGLAVRGVHPAGYLSIIELAVSD